MSEATTAKKHLFEGFDAEARGPWKNGRYQGVIVAEYETTGNFAAVHKTEDRPTAKGDSRNLKLCVTVVNGGQQKSLNYTLNYRPEALDPERIAELKRLRVEYKGQQSWPDKDAQRDNLALTKLHELEKAGVTLEAIEGGGFDTDHMIGQTATFYLSTHRMKSGDSKESEPVPKDLLNDKNTTDEEKARWYNKITGVNPAE